MRCRLQTRSHHIRLQTLGNWNFHMLCSTTVPTFKCFPCYSNFALKLWNNKEFLIPSFQMKKCNATTNLTCNLEGSLRKLTNVPPNKFMYFYSLIYRFCFYFSKSSILVLHYFSHFNFKKSLSTLTGIFVFQTQETDLSGTLFSINKILPRESVQNISAYKKEKCLAARNKKWLKRQRLKKTHIKFVKGN